MNCSKFILVGKIKNLTWLPLFWGLESIKAFLALLRGVCLFDHFLFFFGGDLVFEFSRKEKIAEIPYMQASCYAFEN